MGSLRRIGLDLDNTVIDYTVAYEVLSQRLGLPDSCRSRDDIRSLLRVSPPNDFEWQEFQALLYTTGLEHAQPARGLLVFLQECLSRGVRTFIVSHKTQRTPQMFGAHDLRTPAMAWLFKHRVVPEFVSESDVYFCQTLEEKISKIGEVEVDAFVDDLEQVLVDPRLPINLVRWHYAPDTTPSGQGLEGSTTDFLKLTEWIHSC